MMDQAANGLPVSSNTVWNLPTMLLRKSSLKNSDRSSATERNTFFLAPGCFNHLGYTPSVLKMSASLPLWQRDKRRIEQVDISSGPNPGNHLAWSHVVAPWPIHKFLWHWCPLCYQYWQHLPVLCRIVEKQKEVVSLVSVEAIVGKSLNHVMPPLNLWLPKTLLVHVLSVWIVKIKLCNSDLVKLQIQERCMGLHPHPASWYLLITKE